MGRGLAAAVVAVAVGTSAPFSWAATAGEGEEPRALPLVALEDSDRDSTWPRCQTMAKLDRDGPWRSVEVCGAAKPDTHFDPGPNRIYKLFVKTRRGWFQRRLGESGFVRDREVGGYTTAWFEEPRLERDGERLIVRWRGGEDACMRDVVVVCALRGDRPACTSEVSAKRSETCGDREELTVRDGAVEVRSPRRVIRYEIATPVAR